MPILGRTARGLGYTGYPFLIFLLQLDYGRGTQTHLEKMIILEKWYSKLKAYLPVAFDDNGKRATEYNEILAPLIADVSMEIEIMNDKYEPSFEGLSSCNLEEKAFNKIMRGICERLDVITAKSKILDNIRPDEDIGQVFG